MSRWGMMQLSWGLGPVSRGQYGAREPGNGAKTPVLIGVVLGSLTAWNVSRFVNALWFGVKDANPFSFS
jgi:hypothetical protein